MIDYSVCSNIPLTVNTHISNSSNIGDPESEHGSPESILEDMEEEDGGDAASFYSAQSLPQFPPPPPPPRTPNFSCL